ncbi:hypothetical protein D3C72_1335810 [compost metagenome]
MAHARGVAVGDGQVAFFGMQGQVVAKTGSGQAGRQHDGLGVAPRSVGKSRALRVDLAHFGGFEGQARWRMRQQPAGRAGRIHQAVARYVQCARQAGAQGRFGVGQLLRAKQGGVDAVVAQASLLALGFSHVAVVGGKPHRAASGIGAGWVRVVHAGAPMPPCIQGRGAERQFGRAAVHGNQMPHAGLRGAAQAAVDHAHRHAGLRQLMGTGRADDAGANDQDIRVKVGHRKAPSGGCRRMCQADSPGERVVGRDQQRGFGADVRASADGGNDFPTGYFIAGLEHAADDAGLAPGLTGRELAVGGKAGQLGACARAARRAVIGLAWT